METKFKLKEEEFQKVRLSYGRCAMSPLFFEDFYDNFFASSPDIAPLFEKTDMEKQKKLLQQGITYMIMYAGGSGSAEVRVNELGESHSRKYMNIKPEMYKLWISAVLKTVKTHDEYADEKLLFLWREVLSVGVERMKNMYYS